MGREWEASDERDRNSEMENSEIGAKTLREEGVKPRVALSVPVLSCGL